VTVGLYTPPVGFNIFAICSARVNGLDIYIYLRFKNQEAL
jgi:TRAP-type C4-dicarboxylate transport system permease large subunit